MLFGASLCSFSGSSFLLHRRVPRYCASTVSWGAGYRYKLGFTSNKAVHGRGPGKDMRSLGQILAVAVTLFCLSPARARFVIEQGGLKIKLPATAAAKHRSGFSVSLANFGSPKYGGELVYVATMRVPQSAYTESRRILTNMGAVGDGWST